MKLLMGYILVFFTTVLFANSSAINVTEVHIDRKEFQAKIKKEFLSQGYKYVGAHDNIQAAYKRKFGSTKMEILDFHHYIHPKLFDKLSRENPAGAGSFYPMTIVIFKKIGGEHLYAGFLSEPFVQHVGHFKVSESLKALRYHYKKMRKTILSIAKSDHFEDEALAPTRGIKHAIYEYTVQLPKDKKGKSLERYLRHFSAVYDTMATAGNFISAGYRDVNKDLVKEGNNEFDHFEVYLLCSFPISNEIFNIDPQAGAFAPCPVYFYKKKGSDIMHIGVINMDLWIEYAGIEDKRVQRVIKDAKKEVNFFLKYIAEQAKVMTQDEIELEEFNEEDE